MTEEKPPNPLSDLRKGLGLLFRAATTTARKLPKTNLGKELEDAVVTSAREVGRAFENVAGAIEREVRSRTGSSGPGDAKEEARKDAAKDAHDADEKDPRRP
jgi:hypothetical protein